jgi:hypothetical protein
VENVFHILGGGNGGHVKQPAQEGVARGPCRGEGSSFLP